MSLSRIAACSPRGRRICGTIRSTWRDGLIFNYAVDANWEFPQGDPPYTAPDDFPPAANRAEAWNITVTETENTLYNDGEESGGDLSLAINVYDWFNADMNTVRVESPGNFAMLESAIAVRWRRGLFDI